MENQSRDTDNNKEEVEGVKTPTPPQVMNPNERPAEGENKHAPTSDRNDKQGKPETWNERQQEKQQQPKALGESETEIEDETTI
jgi:hypothetical protein